MSRRLARRGVNPEAGPALEAIIAHATALKPRVMVVDSIQTVWTSALESAPGSVSQVRESAGKLMVLDIPKNSLNSMIFGGNCIRFACHCTDSSFRNVCRQN